MESNSLKTIKSKKDFINLKQSGQKIYTRQGLIFSYINSDFTQCSWTVPKYIGNAVLRNKLKRYCRESLRQHLLNLNELSVNLNIIFPRSKIQNFKSIRYSEFDEAVQFFIKKCKHTRR